MSDGIPTIQLNLSPKQDRRALMGHPWIYSNELAWQPAWRALVPGTLVDLVSARGEFIGRGFFNPHSLIAVRVLTRDPNQAIDTAFFTHLLRSRLTLRDTLYPEPYYRLIHAEADGMPGVVVDRYGDCLVVEINTAGMEQLRDHWLPVVADLCQAKTVILRNEGMARQLEKLAPEKILWRGADPGPITVLENNCRYRTALWDGQKTGWFYDQRDNRALVASMAKSARVLDLYTYLGGFGLLAALQGAASVRLVDRSAAALDLAQHSAADNGIASRVETVTADVFDYLPTLITAYEKFDIVVADPPAFAKAAKDQPGAQKAYQKLAALCAPLLTRGGLLFIASCSHHMPLDEFTSAVAGGLHRAGRGARILRSVGAGIDHPVHPHLPQSAYLKGLWLQVD